MATTRLKDRYEKQVRPELMKEFGFKNPMQAPKLDKIVAIKVLPKKAMADPAAVARFRREMKAVGALHHPNIVGAHDAAEIVLPQQLSAGFVTQEAAQSSTRSMPPLPTRAR